MICLTAAQTADSVNSGWKLVPTKLKFSQILPNSASSIQCTVLQYSHGILLQAPMITLLLASATSTMLCLERPSSWPVLCNATVSVLGNIPLHLKEFMRAKPAGTPEGEGVYLTVYLESSPNTDSISF